MRADHAASGGCAAGCLSARGAYYQACCVLPSICLSCCPLCCLRPVVVPAPRFYPVPAVSPIPCPHNLQMADRWYAAWPSDEQCSESVWVFLSLVFVLLRFFSLSRTHALSLRVCALRSFFFPACRTQLLALHTLTLPINRTRPAGWDCPPETPRGCPGTRVSCDKGGAGGPLFCDT